MNPNVGGYKLYRYLYLWLAKSVDIFYKEQWGSAPASYSGPSDSCWDRWRRHWKQPPTGTTGSRVGGVSTRSTSQWSANQIMFFFGAFIEFCWSLHVNTITTTLPVWSHHIIANRHTLPTHLTCLKYMFVYMSVLRIEWCDGMYVECVHACVYTNMYNIYIYILCTHTHTHTCSLRPSNLHWRWRECLDLLN